MNIVFGHDSTIADWVGKINGKAFHEPYSAFGLVDQKGKLCGGFVFNGFNGDSVEMSLAGAAVAHRDGWKAVLSYVFEQMKCSRLQIHTRRSNKRVRKQAPKLGLTFEGTARRYYGDEDGFVYSLTKDDLPAFTARWRLK